MSCDDLGDEYEEWWASAERMDDGTLGDMDPGERYEWFLENRPDDVDDDDDECTDEYDPDDFMAIW